MGRLDDRVIIVTGGAAGIGRAFAEGFVREGASIVLADINGGASERSAEELRQAGGEALGLTVDVSDPGADRDDGGRDAVSLRGR